MGDLTNEEEDFYSEENLASIDDSDIELDEDTSEQVSDDSEVSNEENEESSEIAGEAEEALAKTYSISLDDIGDLEVENDDDDDVSGDVLSPDEKMRLFADRVISCCFSSDVAMRNYALDTLMTSSSPKLFKDENFVLFSVLHNYRGKLKKITIDEEFLRLFLIRNRGMLSNSKGYIDIHAYGDIDGSAELGYIGGVLKHYKRLVAMEELSEIEFNTYFEKYLIEFKAIEASKAYAQANMILTDGLTIGRKYYMGFEDSSNYLRRRLAEIEGLVNMQKGTGFITDRELLTNEKEGKKAYKIADFDKLEVLNKAYGGIYTGMFYQVIAPPKAGKSKFCARIAHTAKVKFGTNVTVWAHEGGYEAFSAQMRAIHFDYIYNSGVDVTERKYGVSQDAIEHDKFPTDELKQLELSSKLDLASNQDYGTIDYIDRPFDVETFIDDLDTSVKSNNSQLIIIDYLQLISSCRNKTERERVAEAYKDLLVYCKKKNIAVLSPGQYKQDTINELVSKSDTAGAELRTAGGSSSEVVRTPDVIFSLWASTQDLLNNKLYIMSMPCRYSKPFPQTEVIVDLEVCQFVSV